MEELTPGSRGYDLAVGATAQPNATSSMTTTPDAPNIGPPAVAGLSGGLPSAMNPQPAKPATEPAPHESVARHILDALGGSNPADKMGWAKAAIAGTLAGAANVGAVPSGGGFLYGMSRGAAGQQEFHRQQVQDQQKAQQQQQEMQLKQKADARAEQELQTHMEDAKVQRAMMTASTAASVQTQQQNAARFPTLQKEDQLKVKELQDRIQTSEQDNLAVLSAAGVDIQKLEHINSYDQLTADHAKQAGSGSIFAVPNGQEHKEGEDGAGAYIVPGNVWEQPITKPVTITTGYDVDKNGKATPKTMTATEGTKVGTLLAIAKGAQADLANKQKQIFDQASITQKRASAEKDLAEAGKATAEAKAANAFAGTGDGGGTPNIDPKTGADENYLKSLPPNLSASIRAMGEGRVEVNSRTFQSKQGQQMAAALTRAYPGFDQSKAQSYFKMRQDFTSGKVGTAINSYNTSIAHLGTMFDHVSGTNSVQLNNPFSDVHRQLDLDKQLVSTELAKAVSNGQMTEGEKKDILKSISGSTVNSYLIRLKEAVTLLHGKQEAFQEQWNNGAPPGAVSQVHIISPQADQTIARINGHAQAPPPIGTEKTFPNGKVGVWDGKGYVAK